MKHDFFDLLSDHHVDIQQRWSKVKDKLETDQRYKAVESSAAREELYRQYVEKQAKVWDLFGLILSVSSRYLYLLGVHMSPFNIWGLFSMQQKGALP